MLLLNEKNTVSPATFVFGRTVLVCHELHTQFTVRMDSEISANYARDAQNNFYSDAGVVAATRRDILARKPITLYIVGNDVQGWKRGQFFGRVMWSSVYHHNFATQLCSVRVRMFDGSEWYGRYSHTRGEACTLRPAKAWKGA